MDKLEQHYPHAAPAIRHALCHAAHHVGSHQVDNFQRHAALGRCDGLVTALEIVMASEDTPPQPGIAWENLLPVGSVEQARHLLGAAVAERLLGPSVS